MSVSNNKFLAVTAFAALLTGCNQIALPDLTTTGSVFKAKPQQAAYNHTISERRPIQEAFIELPYNSGGGVLDVHQSRYHNGVKQIITYKGDYAAQGENQAVVKIAVDASKIAQSQENLSIATASRSQIIRELKSHFPGASMRLSNELHSNSYGPFGFALGSAPGKVRCIYGWQDMKGQGTDRWAIIRGQSKKPKLSIRLRVCRSNVSSQELVDLMRNLRVNADPERAVRPNPVRWNAGPSGQSVSYDDQTSHTGYISDRLEAAPAAPRVVRRNPQPKKTRTVAKAAAPAVVKQQVENTPHASVPIYSLTIAGHKTVKVSQQANTVAVPVLPKANQISAEIPSPSLIPSTTPKLEKLSMAERLKLIKEGHRKKLAQSSVVEPVVSQSFASVPLPTSE